MDRDNTTPTSKELSALIEESRHDNYLQVAFGGRLLNIASNDWAFKRLEEMRTETIGVGESI